MWTGLYGVDPLSSVLTDEVDHVRPRQWERYFKVHRGVDAQSGWSEVVSNVEQVLDDVEELVKGQLKPGECPFQVPQLLCPTHQT